MGRVKPEKKITLGGLSDFVTVWGAPVWHGPRQVAVVAFLKAEGYEARARGHYIQIRVDVEDPERVELVTVMIRNFKGGTIA